MNDKKKTRRGRKALSQFISGDLVLTRHEFAEWLREHYVTTTMSITEIATMFRVSRTAVCNVMTEAGIRKADEVRREQASANLAKARSVIEAAWERYRNPVTEEEKAERERIRSIKSERAKALLRKARLYNMMGRTDGPKLKFSSHSMAFYAQTFRLRRNGYIVNTDERIAYWTDTTKRSWKVEAERRFFKFAKLGEEAERKSEKNYVRQAFDGNIFYN